MSWNNAWTVKAWSKAKKAGDAEELARLSKLIDSSQERCSLRGHPGPHNTHRLKEDSKSGKYEAGGIFTFCLLCGAKTAYEPPTL